MRLQRNAPNHWCVALDGQAMSREETRARAAPTRRILPMELRVGDRLIDETGEWEIVGRPYTTAGGKNARVRVQRVGEPNNHHLRTWGAHERISVKRIWAYARGGHKSWRSRS